MEKLQFNNKEFEFKKAVRRSSTNEAVWLFTGDISNIEEMKSSCGCTIPVLKQGKITASYKSGDTPGQFSKTVTIYYNDGKPMKIMNASTSQLQWNPNKLKDVLVLKGTIK